MKVSYNQGLASQVDSESCVGVRKDIGEALTGEDAGRVLSLENLMLRSADVVPTDGRQQRVLRHRKQHPHSAWSKALCTHRSISQGRRSLPIGSREIPGLAWMVIQVRGVYPQGERRR